MLELAEMYFFYWSFTKCISQLLVGNCQWLYPGGNIFCFKCYQNEKIHISAMFVQLLGFQESCFNSNDIQCTHFLSQDIIRQLFFHDNRQQLKFSSCMSYCFNSVQKGCSYLLLCRLSSSENWNMPNISWPTPFTNSLIGHSSRYNCHAISMPLR